MFNFPPHPSTPLHPTLNITDSLSICFDLSGTVKLVQSYNPLCCHLLYLILSHGPSWSPTLLSNPILVYILGSYPGPYPLFLSWSLSWSLSSVPIMVPILVLILVPILGPYHEVFSWRGGQRFLYKSCNKTVSIIYIYCM